MNFADILESGWAILLPLSLSFFFFFSVFLLVVGERVWVLGGGWDISIAKELALKLLPV